VRAEFRSAPSARAGATEDGTSSPSWKQSKAVQQQAEGVGQESVTTQTVGAEAVFKLLDAVLALATVVVEGENLRGADGAIGDEETQVGTGRRVLCLVADAALVGPAAGAMAEAGEAALR
jgi:hypothetical protein